MEPFIEAKSSMEILDTAMVSRYGLITRSTKDTGDTDKGVEEAS